MGRKLYPGNNNSGSRILYHKMFYCDFNTLPNNDNDFGQIFLFNALMMEPVGVTETSVNFYRDKRQRIPEDIRFQNHCACSRK
jgi:hypothetical protein